MNILRRPLFKANLGLVRTSFIQQHHQPILIRFQSSLSKKDQNPSSPPSPPPPTQQTPNLPESLRRSIPGETDQSNSIWSRIPTLPLRNNSSLLPKPGVPTSSTHSLRSMLEVLYSKREPELIYEAESHKLYFISCGALALVAILYGSIMLEWTSEIAYEMYKQDGDLLYFSGRIGAITLIAGLAIGFVYTLMKLPTRLIRRIWYLPGKKKDSGFIKFTSHPLLPGRATPVHTIKLKNLNRSAKGRIFTKNGIYGTLDKSTFFFVLKESDKRFGYWLVDRNGWFWGDGRVFDVIFGKESIQEAEEALTYDEKFGKAMEKIENDKSKLKKELGTGYQLKVGADMIKQAIGSKPNEELDLVAKTLGSNSNQSNVPVQKAKKNKKSKKIKTTNKK
ncbi:putative membrane protein [Wickerhamomyces ciferrii]|uniref:Membrane protein n=1 Tax=Wickerhamomyces ciferrii (strain ATCC 14091 / BCRC 22168 / CBS 111 / JCM 3599 / NBRC 0793 / NRRL Y-1031 F-60-10) TaxID=1206466 RepID=K0KLZ4_WICCF|nr:uncharacterized protein BN7_1924 [Wickerhamomyces ciferrii]CCH42379.1 putative membrane protein [Wickerhamomyces ciferrii]